LDDRHHRLSRRQYSLAIYLFSQPQRLFPGKTGDTRLLSSESSGRPEDDRAEEKNTRGRSASTRRPSTAARHLLLTAVYSAIKSALLTSSLILTHLPSLGERISVSW
jgi:hypothetical protein